MKIYLTGGWGYGNIGDEAILMSMLKSLNEQLDSPSIVLTSFDPSQTRRHHGIESLPSIHKLLRLRSLQFLPNLVSLLVWALLYKLTSRHLPLSNDLRAHVEGIERSDLVILGGGGYFNDLWWQALPARLIEIWLPRALDKKVMIYGQTVGPFNTKFSKLFFGYFLNKVDFITFRDAQSELTLSKYGYDKGRKSLLTADEATLVTLNRCKRSLLFKKHGLDPEKLTVGVMFQNFRRYESIHGSEQLGRIKTRQQYLEEVEKMLLNIHSKHRAKFLFLPSTTWDTPFGQRISSRLSLQLGEDVRLIADCGVEEYAALCRSVDVMISTNMHPVILATTNGVPSIAISYFYKIDDFMRSIDQGDGVWRIDQFDPEGIAVQFDNIVHDKANLSVRISKAFRKVKAKAKLNALSAKNMVSGLNEHMVVSDKQGSNGTRKENHGT